MFRFLIALAAGAFFLLLVGPAAVAKEGVRAQLDTPIPVQAASGETITVAWSLYSPDRRPFGAGGVFIRLLSAAGGEPVKAHGQGSGGRFVARVEVPEGGIGGIEIGLEGTRYIGGSAQDADVLFPIDRDPFAAAERQAQNVSKPVNEGASSPSSIWLAAGGALAALAATLGFRRAIGARRERPAEIA